MTRRYIAARAMKRRLTQRANYTERVEVKLTVEQRKTWADLAVADGYEYLAEWLRDTVDELVAKRLAKAGTRPAADVSLPDPAKPQRGGKRSR